MATADLIFLFGEHLPRCTHRIDKHFDDYCTLQYMAAGKIDLSIGTERHALSGAWFWSAYPGPGVRFQPAAGERTWDHRYLAFKGPLVWRWQRDGLFPVAPQRAPGADRDGARFDELLSLTRRADRRSHLKAIHQLEGLLLELSESAPETRPTAAWLEVAMQRVAQWATDESHDETYQPDYDALAAELGTSRSTLRRRFIEVTGTSPHGFYLQCRIAQARQLLGTTELPLKSIALKLGYRDVYFFSRQFRQLVGVPPAAYRRSRQG